MPFLSDHNLELYMSGTFIASGILSNVVQKYPPFARSFFAVFRFVVASQRVRFY